MSKVIIRMQKEIIVTTFSHWHEYASEHRFMANKVRKVIVRWQGAIIYSTLRSWRHYVQLMNSRQALIQNVIVRWEHQTQTKSFYSWRNSVQLSRTIKAPVGMLLTGTTSRSMQTFFMTWRETARQHVDMQEGHLIYAVPRILAVKKRCSFEIWTRYIRKDKHHGQTAKTVGQELTAHAFTTWRLHTSLKVRVLKESKILQERETQMLD